MKLNLRNTKNGFCLQYRKLSNTLAFCEKELRLKIYSGIFRSNLPKLSEKTRFLVFFKNLSNSALEFEVLDFIFPIEFYVS